MSERQPTSSAPSQRLHSPLALVVWGDLLTIALCVIALNIVIYTLIIQPALSLEALSQNNAHESANTLFKNLRGPVGFALIILFQSVIFSAIPIIRISLLRRESLTRIGFQANRPLRLILQGIGLGLAIFIMNALLGAIFVQFGITQNQTDQYPLFIGDWAGQTMIAVATGILAPMGEEILFRGYLFHAFLQDWGAPAAYLLSALLFSLAHSLAVTQGLIALLIPTFLIGLGLAFIVHHTGSIIPCIIAHGINNSMAIGFVLICTNNPTLCLPS